MTPLLFLLTATAGGIGAACRYLLDSAIQRRSRSGVPLGTLLINLSGSLLMGLFTALVLGLWLPVSWLAVLGTGLLGGYTTFSTASVDTVLLLRQRRTSRALGYSIGTLVGSLICCAAGFALGQWLLH